MPETNPTTLSENKTSPTNHKVVTIDTLSDKIERLIVLHTKANPPAEWRDSFKLSVSALLAGSLWIFLGIIALSHVQASGEFSRKIANLPEQDSAKVDQIQKAALSFNDTAKTLYALITPLATAVTGYFFAASGSTSVTRREIDKEEKNLSSDTNSGQND